VKHRGALVVACGLLLAGCSQGVKQGETNSAQTSFASGEYELFHNGEPITPSEYVRTRSVENLSALPEDFRYDLKKALSQREFSTLPLEKRRLLNVAKADSEPAIKAVDAYTFLRSFPTESLKLLPKEHQQELLEDLTEKQLLSLPNLVQDTLKAAAK